MYVLSLYIYILYYILYIYIILYTDILFIYIYIILYYIYGLCLKIPSTCRVYTQNDNVHIVRMEKMKNYLERSECPLFYSFGVPY